MAKTRKRRPADDVFDALIKECYGVSHTEMTRTEQARIGKVVAELMEVNATPDQIHQRVERMRQKWGEAIEITVTAIAAHWAEFGKPTTSERIRRKRDAGFAAMAREHQVSRQQDRVVRDQVALTQSFMDNLSDEDFKRLQCEAVQVCLDLQDPIALAVMQGADPHRETLAWAMIRRQNEGSLKEWLTKKNSGVPI